MLKIINGVLFILLLLQMATVVIMNFYHESIVFKVHALNGYLLIIFVLIHLFLNRKWILSMLKK